MTLTVLAVDDSRTIREMMRLALSSANIDVHLAEDGAIGLEVLKTIMPHVIITDINMPNLDGFGFIKGVRQRAEHKSTPILVLTTEKAGELRKKARDIGASGWIVKPFDKDKLISAIQRVAA
ncbi:MAG: response regulator [Pseudomonadota bacterium]